MSVTTNGWKNEKNENGTTNSACKCGTWKDHWIKLSGKAWPKSCSAYECENTPDIGAHVHNLLVVGEKIVPMCNTCNDRNGAFNLDSGIVLVNAFEASNCGE